LSFDILFKLLGVLVGAYAFLAALKGEVFARSGPWGRIVSRAREPAYFWSVILVYAVLALALLTVF
jgi:hypothetical protein